MIKRFRSWFLTGLVVLLPLALTWFLVWFVVDTVDGIVFPMGYRPQDLFGIRIPGLGLIILLLIIAGCGGLAQNFAGRQIVRWGDAMMARMPLLNTIYTSVKQLLQTLLSEKGRSFKEVVWVEFPSPKSWSLGFVTGEVQASSMDAGIDGTLLAIYVPMTPVPTSGFLIYARSENIRRTKISVQEGLKLVVSGGMVTAHQNKDLIP